MKPSTRFRELINDDDILVVPGATDAWSAHIHEMVGFQAVLLGGFSTSITKLGYPDAGFITGPEMAEASRLTQDRVDIPILVDADNGFGNAINTIRTVRDIIKSGAGALNLEDQVHPKRCGHVKGKQVLSIEEAEGKYRAAADVRDEIDEDFVIIARTDARGAVGGSLDDAIQRVNIYCDAGADVAFADALSSMDDLYRFVDEVDYPVKYNGTAKGISPTLDPKEAEEIGFDCITYPMAKQAVSTGLYKYSSKLREEGVSALVELDEEFRDITGEDWFSFSGFPQIVEWEEEYLPDRELDKYSATIGKDINGKS